MPLYNIILHFATKTKNNRITFSDTLFGQHKIMKSKIFFRPEEAMLETGESLSTKSKIVLLQRK